MTGGHYADVILHGILIHTSVKLVTAKHGFKCLVKGILIHTSVKLVTTMMKRSPASWVNFNPHEREARDDRGGAKSPLQRYFNPHEREARDASGDVEARSL